MTGGYRVAMAALLATLSVASMAQVPPDIAAQTRAAGQTMDPASGQAYAPLHESEPWPGIDVQRDVAYGADPLQRLDVYAPYEGGEGREVLLFVHGGGFTRGDKHGAFYPDNIPLWAAQSGMVGISVNYRLTPDDPWPAGAQDLAAAIAWVEANVARYGGDPNKIVLFGHSAGANHVADYVSHPDVRGDEFGGVRGVVLLSPNYAVAPDPAEPHAYYGAEVERRSLDGAASRLRQAGVPLFIAYAEFDPDAMQATAVALHEGACDPGPRCHALLRLADHNHFTEGMAVGTADESLTRPLIDWIVELGG
jgi:triacylglycerol lipase